MSKDLLNIKQQNVIKRIRSRSTNIDLTHLVRGIGSLYILLDCSGSMEGEKLNKAKKGSLNFAKEAQIKGYAIGLVKFDSDATHICKPLRDISVLSHYLEGIKAGGSTNIADAIQLAKQKLLNKTGFRVMVIVTDGEPTDGEPTPREATLKAAKEAKIIGIDIITIGTDDADRNFLSKLASKTELSVKVKRDQLEKGITSMTKLLPQPSKRVDY